MMQVILAMVAAGGLPRLRGPSPRVGAPAVMRAVEPGEMFPPEAIARLGLDGQRAVVGFVNDDASFMCAKHILGLAETSNALSACSCSVTVVRSPSGAKDGTVARYPSISFVADEADALRSEVGLAEGGGLMGSNERATFVVESNGTVCGVVSNAVEASAHAAYALRLVRQLDAATEAEAEAQRPSFDDLRELVLASATPSEEEEQVEEEQASDRAAAALRAQSIRAEANRNVKFSFGQKTLAQEGERLAAKAAAAHAAAKEEEAAHRAARTRAEAAGNAAAADASRAAAADAAAAARSARADEIAALEIVSDGVEERVTALRMQEERDGIMAREAARIAFGFRRRATQAAVALEERGEQSNMRSELEAWARRQKGDDIEYKRAESYRAAVELAWGQTQELPPDSESRQQARAEAAKWAMDWAELISRVDPDEAMEMRTEAAPSFDSVSQAATFSMASSDAKRAEQEEAMSLSRSARLEATRASLANAEEELDELQIRMGKKTATDKRERRDASDKRMQEMVERLEVAMLRTSESEE